jgi:type IV secretory pathway VirB2 component (pilin)
MAEWIQVVLIAAIGAMFIEARLNFGTRIALVERDLAWMAASLEKWGLIPPKKETKP